jgi:hypothetical protein
MRQRRLPVTAGDIQVLPERDLAPLRLLPTSGRRPGSLDGSYPPLVRLRTIVA